MKKFALAGNPNCGKTTLFNSLTGSTAHVGNWPGVTVESKEGSYKKLKEEVKIVDLPGIYSLSPYTDEEVISRNYIIDNKPDCIINIVDATNLERNLYLTTQLMEIDVPIVIALNMMDAVDKDGNKIDAKELEKYIGIPVVGISALKETNLDELMEVAYKASLEKRKARSILEEGNLGHLISDVTTALKGLKVDNPLFHAIKIAELDEIEIKMHPQVVEMVDEFKKWFNDPTFEKDFEALVADSRYKFITSFSKKVFIRKDSEESLSRSDKIDKVLTNKWLGFPIFFVILFLVFHLTFSENLFYLGGLFKNVSPSFEGSIFEGLLWTESGINSIGVIATNLLTSITDWLTEVIANLLSGIPYAWLNGLIVDGILAGVFAVIGFLPQILCLFLFFSILEDSGYMARIAFILDRLLRKFGLSGRAFLPMIMGFGCSVPAMINTRTLVDDKEKEATIRVIPFFSCGAKLPILTAIAGAIIGSFGVGNADLITYSMYVLGMVSAIVAVLIMRNTSLKGDNPPFIMELPAYHLPQFKSLMHLLWDKAKHFIEKAFTIILASTIVIWFLEHFNFKWQFLDDANMDESIIAAIGQLVQPIFTPLGFGSQLGVEVGWVFVVAAITGLIAKENVVGTLGVLATAIASYMQMEGDDGVGAVEAMINVINSNGVVLNIPALLAFITFNMTTIPCFAACATAKAELKKGRFKNTVFFWLFASYFISSMIYLVGTYVWPIIIYAIIIAATIAFTVYLNKKQKKEKVN